MKRVRCRPNCWSRLRSGQSFEAPEGRIAIEPENHHTWLTPRIGVLRRDGEFDIVWQAKAVVRPDPYLAVTPRVDAWLAH